MKQLKSTYMINCFDPSLILLSIPEHLFFLPSLVHFILQYPKKYSVLSTLIYATAKWYPQEHTMQNNF